MSAAEVATIGLADTAERRAVSVPGFANKVFVDDGGRAARGLVRRIAGIVQSAALSRLPPRQRSAVFDRRELAELGDAMAGLDLAHGARLRPHDE